MSLIDELKKDEGLRLRAYQDHLGVWTIGYGTNLQVLEIDEELAERWLVEKVEDLTESLENILFEREILPRFDIDDNRRNALISMMYQMGVAGTLRFKKMWAAIEEQDWETAAKEMRDSSWWRDPATRGRAERMAVRMETGEW